MTPPGDSGVSGGAVGTPGCRMRRRIATERSGQSVANVAACRRIAARLPCVSGITSSRVMRAGVQPRSRWTTAGTTRAFIIAVRTVSWTSSIRDFTSPMSSVRDAACQPRTSTLPALIWPV